MLRAFQHAQSKLRATTLLDGLSLRSFAAMTWPADIVKPAAVPPFDPKGPLSQFDKLAEGLDANDPYVKAVIDLKDLRVAVDKLKVEQNAVRAPDAWRSHQPQHAR